MFGFQKRKILFQVVISFMFFCVVSTSEAQSNTTEKEIFISKLNELVSCVETPVETTLKTNILKTLTNIKSKYPDIYDAFRDSIENIEKQSSEKEHPGKFFSNRLYLFVFLSWTVLVIGTVVIALK